MTFSLLDQNWIPARFAGGETRWIALHDIVGDDPPLDVEWGRPELRTATYELLIGLFAVALAARLGCAEDWAELLDAPPTPEELRQALAALAPYLILDGDGPRFAQDLSELSGEIRAPDALLLDSPGDNTLKNGADLFAKRDRFAVLSRKAAAVALYALQAFAPSGGAGHRTSMRGGGPLTTLVVPEAAQGHTAPTLWRRIVANLPSTRGEQAPPRDWGLIFPWAKPTRVSTSDVKTERGPDAHGLQCFFGMPRRIRLVFTLNPERRPCALTGEIDDTVVTGFRTEPWGVSYGVWTHPLSPYYEVKNGPNPLPVHAQNGRIGYRDWAGYLFSRPEEGRAPTRPAAQAMAFTRTFPRQRDARLSAMGFVTDNMKVLDWVEAEAPLFALPNSHARERLADFARERLVGAAVATESALRVALREAFDAGAEKTQIAAALERLWIETEEAFFARLQAAAAKLRALAPDADEDAVEALDFTDAQRDWLERALRPAALAIFNQAAPVERLSDLENRQVERIVEAAKGLRLALRGYGAMGAELFKALDLAVPEQKSRKPRAGATQGVSA